MEEGGIELKWRIRQHQANPACCRGRGESREGREGYVMVGRKREVEMLVYNGHWEWKGGVEMEVRMPDLSGLEVRSSDT